MRSKGSAAELERRRLLAVQHVRDGKDEAEVASILGVRRRTVYKWAKMAREGGLAALKARAGSGRKRKLSAKQERVVLSWFRRSPLDFGYSTDLWTARRVREQIFKRWKIQFHERYLSLWLKRRAITPQKPERVARERDEAAIARWVKRDWPRIKKGS